jgi:hypothetical protein
MRLIDMAVFFSAHVLVPVQGNLSRYHFHLESTIDIEIWHLKSFHIEFVLLRRFWEVLWSGGDLFIHNI